MRISFCLQADRQQRVRSMISQCFIIGLVFNLFHYELQRPASHNLLMGNLVVLNRLAVQLHALDVNTFRRLVRRADDKVLAVLKMLGGFSKQWRTDDILG